MRPGEVLWLDDEGIHSAQAVPEGRDAACIFEHVYFARPDSRLGGSEIHSSRVRMGERLAEEAPVVADLVMPIPDSGTPAAIGFAKASGIPFDEGLIKNRYVGRTFIQPDQELRRQGIRLKFNPLDEVAGKRVVIVDDSIVRGNTMQQLIAMLFDAGAAEVHVRISSPPVVSPVLLRDRHGRRGRARGVAPLGRGDARADRRDLAALPLARRDAVGDEAARGRVCRACFTREYPTAVPEGARPRSCGSRQPRGRARAGRRPTHAVGSGRVPPEQTYAAAGVSLATADAIVDRLRAAVASTAHARRRRRVRRVRRPLRDRRPPPARRVHRLRRLEARARPRAATACAGAARISPRTASTTC